MKEKIKGVAFVKILALWGKGSKGKTHTLNLLADLLTNNFTNSHKAEHAVTSPVDISKDNRYVIHYRKKTIGIITNGDDGDVLRKGFDWLDDTCGKNQCDLYVCATRSKGSSCEYVEMKAASGDIFWFAKASATHQEKGVYTDSTFIQNVQETVNDTQARELKNVIDHMINGHII